MVWLRFAYAYVIQGEGAGHVQSLILGAVLFNTAALLFALGIIGDQLNGQRVLTQRTLERVRRVELQLGVAPSHYEPGAQDTGQERTTGAAAGSATGKTGEHPRVPAAHAMTQLAADPVPTGNTYDKYNTTNPVARRLQAGFERSLDELFERAGPRSLLDIGCGEGVLTYEWAQRLGERRVVGIDLEDPKLAAEWEKRSRPNLDYRVMRAENLPFADDEFDLATAIEVLEHVPDPEHTVAEMARVAERHLLVERPARAAVARAQPRARRLRARARQHPGAPQPLVQALVRLAAGASRRGHRVALAAALDHVASPPVGVRRDEDPLLRARRDDPLDRHRHHRAGHLRLLLGGQPRAVGGRLQAA